MNVEINMERNSSHVEGVTVVVPTYNASTLLVRTLDSLFHQTLLMDHYEVIVVDDGSSDDTEQVVADYTRRYACHYFFQSDKGFRAAAARNIGIHHARHKVVLFIDAGIIVAPDLLAIHHEAHRRTSTLALIGISYGVCDYGNRSASLIEAADGSNIEATLRTLREIPESYDSRTEYLERISYDLSRMKAPWLLFWGGHVSVPTAVLRQLGGFDEWFHRWGGEDNELGLRLFQAGCRFQALPGVHSIHIPHPKDPAQKRRDARFNTQYIHKKHGLPETEALIHHNWRCMVDEEPHQHCTRFGCIDGGLDSSICPSSGEARRETKMA
jgi:glycosyltransferase involved in cell wall biosynthesis